MYRRRRSIHQFGTYIRGLHALDQVGLKETVENITVPVYVSRLALCGR